MFRFKISRLLLFPLLGLISVDTSIAESHLCIAVGGGFGHGGTTFIGSGFALPAVNNCTPWAGFTKTASSVILTTSGTGCLSSDGKVLTVSVLNADPSFFGSGQTRADYIRLTRSSTSVGFSAGQDNGYFVGSANTLTCTTALLQLPPNHD
jgi:hypothetical protein